MFSDGQDDRPRQSRPPRDIDGILPLFVDLNQLLAKNEIEFLTPNNTLAVAISRRVVRGLSKMTMSNGTKTLYERLGGYTAIAAVAYDLLPRLRADPQLGRFWAQSWKTG